MEETSTAGPPGAKCDRKGPRGKIDNGFYLSIILGNTIDLSMSSSDRFLFKRDYENFKLRVTLINMVLLCIDFLFPSRPLDMICHFLMVWYYCTLTIRESILRINGSQMHWWWVAHHYLATVIGGVAVTWPDGEHYQAFRTQFLLFAVYISVCQQLQFKYQSGCLRRLLCLGKGDSMDLTLEGFSEWMFQGLTFLLPFLVIAYVFELHHSYTLYRMWTEGGTTFHVPVLSLLFFIVGNGNLLMVGVVVLRKAREDPKQRNRTLKAKYAGIERIGKIQ